MRKNSHGMRDGLFSFEELCLIGIINKRSMTLYCSRKKRSIPDIIRQQATEQWDESLSVLLTREKDYASHRRLFILVVVNINKILVCSTRLDFS